MFRHGILILCSALVCNDGSAALIEGTSGPLSFSIGGRVKMDAIYSWQAARKDRNTPADFALVPAAIALSTTERRFAVSARNSRLWLKFHYQSPQQLAAFIEMDWSEPLSRRDRPGSNAYNARLRHAYAQFGSFSIGQTNSTAMNITAFPETNDDNGPVGLINARQALLRWSYRKGAWELSIAGEEAQTRYVDSRGQTQQTDAGTKRPDVAVRLRFENSSANLSLAVVQRRLASADGKHRDGVLINASGRIAAGGLNNFRFGLHGGNAVGRYASSGLFESSFQSTDKGLSTRSSWGSHLSYQHWWSSQWRSNLVAGYARAETVNNGQLRNKKAWSVHVNLLRNFGAATRLGLEFIHAERVTGSGQSGNLDRVQFSLIHRY